MQPEILCIYSHMNAYNLFPRVQARLLHAIDCFSKQLIFALINKKKLVSRKELNDLNIVTYEAPIFQAYNLGKNSLEMCLIM